MSQGVIYLATGKPKYIRECLFSASSLKKHCPDLPITLFTDNPNLKSSLFEQIIVVNDNLHPLKKKVRYLVDSPYERTLFLDTDTQVLKPIYEMFEWLDDYDFCIGNAPDIVREKQHLKLQSYTHKSYNTGVFLYRKNAYTLAFFKKWLELVNCQDETKMKPGLYCDQDCFNQLILTNNYHLECNMIIKVFPNVIYNARPLIIEKLRKEGKLKNTKILHAHDLDNPYRKAIRFLKSQVRFYLLDRLPEKLVINIKNFIR